MTPEQQDSVIQLATAHADSVVESLEATLAAAHADLLQRAGQHPADVIMLGVIGRLFVREVLRQVERYKGAIDYRHVSGMLEQLVGPLGPLNAELRRELGKRVAS